MRLPFKKIVALIKRATVALAIMPTLQAGGKKMDGKKKSLLFILFIVAD